MSTDPYPTIRWQEAGVEHVALWRSEAGVAAPEMVVVADDTLKAGAACRLAAQGTAILWRGDYQNARNLLQALARRVDRRPREGAQKKTLTPAEAFHRHREAQGRRAAILGRLLVPLTADYRVPLRRGQAVAAACREALGPGGEDSVISLRGLLALVSAHEWRKKGIPVPAVAGRIYPHFGVFSPVRGEYVDLVAKAPLPAGCELAFDIGTGSGILAAVLARRGIRRVVATDHDHCGECLQDQQELALGDHVCLAGFVDQFADLGHRAMYRKTVNLTVNHRTEDETSDANQKSVGKQSPA